MYVEASCASKSVRDLVFCRVLWAVPCYVVLAFLLSACGAIRGAPDPIQTIDQEKTDLSPYLTGDVLGKASAPSNKTRLDMSPLAWRDSVIAARLEIIDQNFQAFKNELYAETAGVNLGTDLIALGLTAGASVAGAGTAQALAAASTGILGAGTAFNKDAFYQRTLPAIFAQMEADRTAVLVRIRASQLNDETKYPLSIALADVTAYERAGTLETALQALTASATNQADANKKQLLQITGLTILAPDVAARKQKFSDYIAGLVAQHQKTKLDLIASKVGAATDTNIVVERRNILITVDKLVNGENAAAAMTNLSDQLFAITQTTF